MGEEKERSEPGGDGREEMGGGRKQKSGKQKDEGTVCKVGRLQEPYRGESTKYHPDRVPTFPYFLCVPPMYYVDRYYICRYWSKSRPG